MRNLHNNDAVVIWVVVLVVLALCLVQVNGKAILGPSSVPTVASHGR